MNKLITYLSLGLSLLLCTTFGAYSQHVGYNNFVPASPGASATASNQSVSLSSGALTQNIPITSYRTRNINVPISLGYHSSGFRVAQLPTAVGQDWALHAGGVISRTVRDEVDPANPSGQYPQNLKQLDADDYTFITQGAQDSGFDTEPDLYSFSFGGYSGSFVSDGNGGFVMMPYQQLVVEPMLSGSTLAGFKVTTPTGVKYTFGGLPERMETSKSWSTCEGMSVEETDSLEEHASVLTTAWYLYEIGHPMGDKVTFDYTSQVKQYISGITQQWVRRKIGNEGDCPDMDKECVNYVEHKELLISRIYASELGYGTVHFTPGSIGDIRVLSGLNVKNAMGNIMDQFELKYDVLASDRLFLTRLAQKNTLGEEGAVHLFEYRDLDDIPSRLSRAQDHWGYYNGKNNYDFIPKNNPYQDLVSRIGLFGTTGADRSPDGTFADNGLLSKITYPTGGSTAFTYEPNTVRENKTLFGSPNTVSVDLEFCPAQDPIPNETFDIWVDEDISLSVPKGRVDIRNLTLNSSQEFSSSPSSYVVSLKAGMSYEVSLYHEGGNPEAGECNSASFSYHTYSTQNTVAANVQTGGVRVKQMAQYDPISGKTNSTRYYYGKKESPQTSSGHRNIKYNYDSYYSEFIVKSENPSDPCTIDYECAYGAIHSNSVNTAHNTAQDRLTYEYVTVSRGGDNFENGGEQYHFGITDDAIAQTIIGQRLKDSPYSNTGWTNGLLQDSEVFRKEGAEFVILKKQQNYYHKDDRVLAAVPGYVVRKRYDSSCLNAIICDEENTQTTEYYICRTVHAHEVSTANGECTALGNDNHVILNNNSPCVGQSEGFVVNVDEALSHIDVMQYMNLSHWYYLSKSLHYQYDENGQNPVTTETQYTYGGESHPFLTKSTITGSRGDVSETRYKYPQDYTVADGSVMDHMVQKNILAIPIEVIQSLNGTIIAASASKFEYDATNGFVALKANYAFENTGSVLIESSDGVSFVAPYSLEMEVLTRDDNGRIISQRSKKNVITTYVRGYYQSRIVAQVQNATADQVKTALGLSDNLNLGLGYNGMSIEQNAALRNTLPQALVSSYTYKMGYGIETVTDPNERQMTYIYDAFRQVKYVKDDDGHIVSEHNYHIINQ